MAVETKGNRDERKDLVGGKEWKNGEKKGDTELILDEGTKLKVIRGKREPCGRERCLNKGKG